MKRSRRKPTRYQKLVATVRPPPPPVKSLENELDTILSTIKKRGKNNQATGPAAVPDRIETLRVMLINELIPVFVELMEKYSQSGISLEMDASNFLEGGREIRFEFGYGEHRTRLVGTVISEGIAFQEIRQTPEIHGEIASGPMLSLRRLSPNVFREFVCERLTIILRAAMRRR